MRQAEFLEQAARALSDSWMSWNVNVSLLHDAWLDVVWTHTHNVWERVVNGIIEVTKNATDCRSALWTKSANKRRARTAGSCRRMITPGSTGAKCRSRWSRWGIW
jgi:hypothetical protein